MAEGKLKLNQSALSEMQLKVRLETHSNDNNCNYFTMTEDFDCHALHFFSKVLFFLSPDSYLIINEKV